MAALNKAMLIGRLGQDPKVHVFNNGDKKVNFSVATSQSWKDKTTGEKQTKTEWHNIDAYGAVAAICEQYLSKGSHVFVEGRLTTEKYTDKHNIERSATKIILEKLQMLDGKDRVPGGGAEPDGNIAPTNNSFDDDIPF